MDADFSMGNQPGGLPLRLEGTCFETCVCGVFGASSSMDLDSVGCRELLQRGKPHINALANLDELDRTCS